MDNKLLDELIEDTGIEDIPEKYHEIVRIVGIRKFVELSDYARGDEVYFPKVENILSSARNRKIKQEFSSGCTDKQISERYNLTLKQVWKILRDEPPQGQMSIEEWMNAGG